MDVTTLVIAVIGLLLSVTSLVWQAATWKLSGPRVKVVMLVGATNGSQYGTIPVKPQWRESIESFAKNGLLHRLIAAEITNSGRAATTVVGYKVEFDTGVKLGVTAAPRGLPPLPHRLEAHSQVLYYLDLEDVLHALAGLHNTPQQPKALWMIAELGDGSTAKSDRVSASTFWSP